LISTLISLWENVLIALRALAQNKLRAILTTLGIIIGVLTVVSVASIIAGLNEGFSSQISALGSNTLFIHKYPWIIKDDFFKYRNRPDITMNDAEYLIKHSRLAESIAPATGTSRDIKFRNNSLSDINIAGVTVEHEQIEGYTIADGRYFTQTEIDRDKPSCVIGWEIKEKLFKDLHPIGERIKIGDVSYTVIGIMDKRGSLLGHNLDSEVYVPIGTIFKNFGAHRSIRILVKVPSAEMINEVKDEIRFLLRVSRKLKPQEEDNFSINQQEMLTDMYKQLTGGLYTAAFGIGTLSLLVGGIGIMNIMLVSVTERTREIGIRKAIGAKRSNILSQFLLEAMVLSGLGGLAGMALGAFSAVAISRMIQITPIFSIPMIAFSLFFSLAVGVIFGLYPAYRASLLSPIEALRFE